MTKEEEQEDFEEFQATEFEELDKFLDEVE